MKIYAKTKQHRDGTEEYYNRLPKPTQVNILGEYLRKHLTGVYRYNKLSSQYELYSTIMYQLPKELRKQLKKYPEWKEKAEDIFEVNVYFNITTYQQYIRVNIILLDENEATLGYKRFEPRELISLPACKDKLLEFTQEKITKYLEKYDVQI